MAGELLAEAERAGARVTVLAVGTWLEQYPQMAWRILGGGHDLGNHAWPRTALGHICRTRCDPQ
jgi:peptidoglycan/xylan/chitin deacetylase (PgdA/CDA1 family)